MKKLYSTANVSTMMGKRQSRRASRITLSAVSLLVAAAGAQGAAFTAGDLVVDRVGTGTGALANTATAAFIDEYSSTTAAQVSTVQSISISQGANTLTQSGSATSEGLLNRSADGTSLVVPGYNASGINVVGANSTAAPRAIAVFGSAGTQTGFSTLGTAFSVNNIRSAASTNGTALYASGGNTGIVYATANTNGSTVVYSTITNLRSLEIFTPTTTNTQSIYFSTGSGTTGVYIASGVPTASGATATLLVADASPYGFSVSPDGKTVYVADDATGIKKFTSTTGAAGSFTLAATFATASRGLTVDYSGANPILYATSALASANTLFSITDAGTATFASQTAVTLATAATNTAFRGVDFAPVPEPATCIAGALTALSLAWSLRKRLIPSKNETLLS